MDNIFIKEIGRIKKAQKELEKALDVKLTFAKDGIRIEGKEEFNEYIALQAIEALNMGFNVKSAIKLKDPDYMLEIINIKKHTRPSRLVTIKGRLIGKEGKALVTLSELTGCDLRIKDYDLGIIGKTSDIKFAVNALVNLIHGSPHSNVYSYLEKSRPLREIREDEKGKVSFE